MRFPHYEDPWRPFFLRIENDEACLRPIIWIVHDRHRGAVGQFLSD